MEPRLRGKKQKNEKKPVEQENQLDSKRKPAKKVTTQQFWKRTYKLLLVLTVGLSIWSIYTVINRYRISLDWSRNGNSELTMAKQTPDSLYDSNADSKAAKQKFNEIYANSYNSKTNDITSKATTNEMKKLHQTLPDISAESRSEYQTKYDNIVKKVKVNALYRDIFVNNNEQTIKANVTPETIQKLNNDQFGYINQLLIDSSNKDKFAKRIYDLQVNLAKDAVAINGVMDIVMKTVNYEPTSGKVVILKNSTDQQVEDYKTATGRLNFSWKNLAFINQIEKVIAKDLAKQTEQYRVFDNYKKDLSDKEKKDKDIGTLDKNLSDALKKQKTDEEQAKNYIKIPKFTSQSEAQSWADRNSIKVAFTQKWSKTDAIISTPTEGKLLKRTDKLTVIIQRKSSGGTSADSVKSNPSASSSSEIDKKADSSSIDESSSSTKESSSKSESSASNATEVSSSSSVASTIK